MYEIKVKSLENVISVKHVTTTIDIKTSGRGPQGPTGPQGPQGIPGEGVPVGGTTGQVLAKESNDNYDTEWKTLSKSDVGLGNVDNTSDINKPISIATQAALNLKVSKGEIVVNVLDYGAVGDGVTDDTVAFAAAFAAGGTVIFPKPSVAYLVKYFSMPSNKRAIGIGMPQINIQRNGATAISIIRTGCVAEGLYLNSLDTNLNNNRVGIESASDVVVRKCKIEGFRHISATPNAWGLYITSSSNVTIENCQFENNTQSDIAVVDGCTNIAISNCYGSNFVIDIEPNGTSVDEDITIDTCRIALLYLLENSFLVHAIKSITVKSCIIDQLRWRGANATFIDTRITNWYTHTTGNRYGAKVNSLGSFGFGENINNDPLFHRILQTGDSKTSWVMGYAQDGSTLDWKDDVTKGRYLVLNPNGINTTISISKKIPVDPQATYSMRALFNTFFPTGSGTTNGFRLRYYDASDVLISSFGDICFDRKEGYDNAETAWDEKTTFFETPALCAYVEVTISNATQGSTSSHKLNIQRLTISKLILDAKNNVRNEFRTVTDSGPSLVAITAVGSGQNQSLAGQVIYSKNPFTVGYDRWICLTSGNPGVWRGISIEEPWTAYNTVDKTVNFERVLGRWTSDIFKIYTERGGTGTVVRPLQFGNISSLTLSESASPAFRYNRLTTTDTSAAQVQFSHAGLGASSGTQIFFQNTPTVTQSGTAGFTANDTNVIESSVGSGTKLLHNWRVGGVSKASIDHLGNITALNLSGTNTGDQTATTTSNTPAGNIAATTVQDAINELDSEKVSKSGDTMTGTITVPSVVLTSGNFNSSSTAGLLRISSGTIDNGGVIVMGGSTNGSIPNSGILRVATNNIVTWDTNGITMADAKNIILNATTGTKIGTATTQKIGLWNKTPIVQPTTSITGATRVGGGGAALTDTDTFDGYTIAKVVRALVNLGVLA